MKEMIISTTSAGLFFLAFLMIAASGGTLDQTGEIITSVKLAAGAITAFVAAAGIAGWRDL